MKRSRKKPPPHYALFLPLAAKDPEKSFLPHDPEIIFEEMADIFRRLEIKKTFYIGEPFWQTDHTYQETCLALKIPYYTGNIYNLPLAAKMVKHLNSEAVITTEKIFSAFKNHLKNVDSIKLWYFFGKISAGTALEISKHWPEAKVFQQYAPFAAIPSGYQCAYLANNLNGFHPSTRRETALSLSLRKEIIIEIKKPLLTKTLKYKTNDIGEFIEKKCPCGEKIFRVEV